MDGDVLFVDSASDAYISGCVDFCDGKWSFGQGGKFCFIFALIQFLYNKYQISNFVIMRYSVLVFFFIVRNGLDVVF